MTDQTNEFRGEPDEFRGETTGDDVEGHQKLNDPDDAKFQTDEGDDDVEGHMTLREPGLSEPKL